MIAGLMLAAAVARPADGTYAFRLTVGGATVGTSTVVVTTAGTQITAVENASLITGQTARTTTVYDGMTLDERSYEADVTRSDGSNHHTAVTIAGGKATINVGAQHVEVAADPAARTLITTDNLPGDALFVPAILHAHHASALSLAILANGQVAVQRVDSDESGILKTSVGALSLTYTYDPHTLVVRGMDVPQQQAHVTLTSQSASTSPAATPSPPPTPLPLAPARYRSEDVTFTSHDGTRLAGTLTIPNGNAARYPAIVLVHGSGPETRDEQIGPNPVFLQLTNALSNAGVIVLRYDKRGVGKSGGNAAAMTRENLLQDIEAALAFVRSQPRVDLAHVFLLGHSEGGELVPTVAARTRGIAGIVLMAPPAVPLAQLSMEQTLEDTPPAKRAQVRREEAATLQSIRSGETTGMTWYRSSMDLDPITDIKRVRVPILILQGGADAQVLPKDLPRLVQAAKTQNADVTVRVFPGDNHLFMHAQPGTQSSPQAALRQYLAVPDRVDPAMLQTLIAWLQHHGV